MEIELKIAKIEDAKMLFKWANDPDMRKNSFNTKNIIWKDHVRWLRKKLLSSDTKIYIAFLNNVPFGQIRFDKQNQSAFIDYYVDKKYRGMGLGKELLLQGFEVITHEWYEITSVVGEVKKNNISSIKAFISAGFEETNKDEYVIYNKKSIIKR